MKQKRLGLVILIVATLLLGGCRWAHKVAVTQVDESAPRFALYTPSSGWLHPESFGVEIYQFAVLHRPRVESSHRYYQVWAIKTQSQTPVIVKEIVYGIVPSGFEEIVPAQPLVAGGIYEIMSSRPGNTGGGGFQAERDWPARGK